MTDAATLPLPRRSFARGARDVIVCSLLVTSCAAALATIVAIPSELRWSVVFVIIRWLFVAALLLTPLIHQLVVRTGRSWRMPWVLQTPATALVLTIESILLDVLSANLG